MNKTRLEAFSDGVIAIILTIMILSLPVPHTANLADLAQLYPILISYIISFFFVMIYWINHHYLLHLVDRVRGSILWKNALFLFFLSFVPWATAYMGVNHFDRVTVIVYTVVCLLAALFFSLLVNDVSNLKAQDEDYKELMRALKPRENLTTVAYLLALASSFYWPPVSLVILFLVSCMWVVPNKKFETFLASK